MNSIFLSHKKPRITLVGAGPGDAELLTLKAVRALKEADIVLYDALVSDDILSLVPVGTPVLDVGKRPGAHRYKQDEINELIVEFAHLYGHVVRLKGGDPFVFGRGGEELAYAVSRNIQVNIVPGISSALAVPATDDIPMTIRGISESFWVVTGATAAGELSRDIVLAAQSTATVVILMGMNKLKEIMEVFRRYGKENTSAAIIQNGTMHNCRRLFATVAVLAELAAREGIGSPAVIVVGDVVRFAASLRKRGERIAELH